MNEILCGAKDVRVSKKLPVNPPFAYVNAALPVVTVAFPPDTVCHERLFGDVELQVNTFPF
jgi:hypothetical protein